MLPESELAAIRPKKFVEQYLMGEMRRELSFMLVQPHFDSSKLNCCRVSRLTCDEASDELPSISNETFTKIECNINMGTNYMLQGIMNVRMHLHNLPHTHLELSCAQSLDQKVEKRSPSLGREAMYSQKSRVTRLPGYLVVHMVRFAWRQDIGKKAKIMVNTSWDLVVSI